MQRSLLIILILVGVFSFFLRNEINHDDNKVFSERKTHLEPTNSINKSASEANNLIKSNNKATKKGTFVNSPSYVADQYNRICNKSSSELIKHSQLIESISKKEKVKNNSMHLTN